jgi:uncharacterized protein with HEPN domain
MTQETFESSGMTYDAVIRNLEVIGEAAKQIPQDMRDSAPDIPWPVLRLLPLPPAMHRLGCQPEG